MRGMARLRGTLLLVAAATTAGVLVSSLGGGGRFESALGEWSESGEPLSAHELPVPAGASAADFDAWSSAADRWRRAYQLRQRVLVDGKPPTDDDWTTAELAAVRRLLVAEPTAVVSSQGNAGSKRARELAGAFAELDDRLAEGEVPPPGTRLGDLLTAAVATSRPIVEGLLAAGPPPATDRRAELDAHASVGDRFFGTHDPWQFGVLASAVSHHIADAIRAGQPGLAELTHLALDLWSQRADGWTLSALVNHGPACDRLLAGVALAAAHLGGDQRARVRRRIETVDGAASTERLFLRARVLGHAGWERAIASGSAPVGFPGCAIVTGSRLERWVEGRRAQLEEFFAPEICRAEHARFLEGAAAALASLRSAGLDRSHPASVEEVLEFDPAVDAHFADRLLRGWAAAYDGAVVDEARRRLALCGLAWAGGGQVALDRALERHRDPWTGRAFASVSGPGGSRILVAATGGSAGSPRWALGGP